MKDYLIETLYDEGYINGEVYYLCDENGISYLADAIKFFNEPNPPKYIEALHRVYLELFPEKTESLEEWPGWKEDCNNIMKSSFRGFHEAFNQFKSFAVFVIYVQSQDLLFGQYRYYCSCTFKNEIVTYWQSRQPEIKDSSTAPWRTVCKQYLAESTPYVKQTLSTLIDLYPNASSFLSDLQEPTYVDEILKIKSFGQNRRQLIKELVSKFLECLISYGSECKSLPQKEPSLLQNETLLSSVFYESLNGYSVRANGAIRMAKDRFNSYSDFFNWVLSSDFNPLLLKNVGRKTANELGKWKTSIQVYFPPHKLNAEMQNSETVENDINNAISETDKEALFDELFNFINSLKESKKLLAYYLAENGRVNELSLLAEKLNLSKERVRQLIPAVLADIEEFLIRKRKTFVYTKDEYFHLAHQCGHPLNKQFEIWVGTQISSEIASIGSFNNYIFKGGLFLMVDAKLASVFDFDLFINKISSLAGEKYYEETKIKIEDLVLDCFPAEVTFEFLPAITRMCRTILYDHYPYHLSENEIVIPANAYYSIRQRVEDILANTGSALTIASIRTKLQEKGAAFNGSDNQLVAMIRKSSSIISYGYPCKFGLAVWGKPEEEAYGTIRDVAIHILLKHNPPIMTETDLVSALLTIYTESSERSIISNLMADSRQRFRIFQREDIRYIGLTKETYDSTIFIPVNNEIKKPASTSQNKLSWQGTFDSVKRVLGSHDWTSLDEQQRKWLITNWKKAQRGLLKDWQTSQILELIETSKKK